VARQGPLACPRSTRRPGEPDRAPQLYLRDHKAGHCGPAALRPCVSCSGRSANARRKSSSRLRLITRPWHAETFLWGNGPSPGRKTPAVRRRIAGTAAGLPRPGRARRGWPRTGARAAAALAVGRSAPWAEGIPIAAWATQSEPRGTRNATWASPSASGPSCPRRRLRPAGAARGV